jgi:hypothetical protein
LQSSPNQLLGQGLEKAVFRVIATVIGELALDRLWGGVAVGWPDRVLRELVKGVREQGLLVLLLVVTSELDQLSDLPG